MGGPRALVPMSIVGLLLLNGALPVANGVAWAAARTSTRSVPAQESVVEGTIARTNRAMVELGVLTLMTLTLVGSLVILRKRRPDAVAERA